MNDNEDLKQIKKYYGEKMMHLCRELFPTILEHKGLLPKILESKFAYSKSLYDDLITEDMIEDFKSLIFSTVDVENNNEIITLKTPRELLDEAGYILYECNTEEEIQSFKKYYAPKEELCTFLGRRLERCHVFFAVKRDVDKIKREDFSNPKREDLYGTSVISIQFTKDRLNTLSIKNRYNHTVNNPDATFSNNLDNIIPGLTHSFNETYNLNSSKSDNFDLPNYVRAKDGKYYKYNYEINNIYYCTDNIIIDHFEVDKEYNKEKERYIVFDYFILDLKEKTLKVMNDCTTDTLIDTIGKIETIKIESDKSTKNRTIIINNSTKLVIDKDNRLIEYENNNIEKIGNNFLADSEYIKKVSIPNVKEIGDNFLIFNEKLEEIDVHNVCEIGDNFIHSSNIEKIDLPKVKKIGSNFMHNNFQITELYLPELESFKDNFLYNSSLLKKLVMPKVKSIGDYFLVSNLYLSELDLSSCEKIGNNFLTNNITLKELNLPNIKTIGTRFLMVNRDIEEFSAPKLECVGDDFLPNNYLLKSISLPELKYAGNNFLLWNMKIEYVDLPKLERVGYSFMHNNKYLEELDLPNLKETDMYFLGNNKPLKILLTPKLERIDNEFLKSNISLTFYDLSSLNDECIMYLPEHIKESLERKTK